jgi:mono/diheme cytochrome c family protein
VTARRFRIVDVVRASGAHRVTRALVQDEEGVMTQRRRVHAAAALVGLGLALGVTVRATAPPGQTAPQIKEVPCNAILSLEGRDNFLAYCAVCHGADAKGTGPAARVLKVPVPDLTTLAKRHGGKFDYFAVLRQVSGEDRMPPVHGTTTMPMWGPVFRNAQYDRAIVKLRLESLVKYLQSIQAE